MLLMALALAAGGQQVAGLPLDYHAGGFCTGLGWVSVKDGWNLSVDHGPDFLVFRYDRSPTSWWGVYSGRAALVPGSKREPFFTSHGVKVSRLTVEGEFRGYLAVNRRGYQNHFYGSPFTGESTDKAFFDKVDFSAAALAKCKQQTLR